MLSCMVLTNEPILMWEIINVKIKIKEYIDVVSAVKLATINEHIKEDKI